MSRSLLGIAMCCVLLLVLMLWLLLLFAFAPFARLFLLALASPCILLLSLACKSFHSSNTFSRFPFLAKTGFSSGVLLALFWLFFSSLFFNIVFTSFFFDFGGFGRPKWLPKSIFGEVFGMLFGHPHLGAIF